jgi:chromosome segregation ATPase
LKATQAELFSLQLENYFLKEQLSKMAPDHIEAALKENVKLKLEILNLSKEMKTMKKLVTQQDKDLAEAQKERDMASSNKHRGEELRQLEAAYQAEREKRKAAEQKLQDAGDEEGLRADLEDAEASETIWRNKAEELEDQLEEANARISDQAEEIERLTDAKDRAEDELERKNSDLGSSVGVGRGREARTIAKLEQVSLRICQLDS